MTRSDGHLYAKMCFPVLTFFIENVRPHAVIWKGQNRVTRVQDSTVRPP